MLRRRESRAPLIAALVVALLVHVPLGWWFLKRTFLDDSVPPPRSRPLQVSLLNVAPPDEPEEEEEPEDKDEMGQVVDIAPPEKPEKPDEAKFLAEYDNTVPEETVDPRFRVNREVTAETYSPEDAYEVEGDVEMDQPLPSSGATAGREIFKTGRYSLFPDRKSMWDRSASEGLDMPVASTHSRNRMSGSPSNDYLPEISVADKTALNAHEFLFASYINRVGAIISFYMSQTLANAHPRVPIVNSKYAVGYQLLIDAEGRIDGLEIVQASGVPAFDDALRQAVELGAPFPEPPPNGLNDDGVFVLTGQFVIPIGRAQADMSSIDPRAGVQFPGLERTPR